MSPRLLTNKYLLIALGIVAIVGLIYIGYTAVQSSNSPTNLSTQATFQPKTATLQPPVKDKPVSGQIIVKFNPQYTDAQINQYLQQYHASVTRTIEGINQKVVKVPPGQEQEIIQKLHHDGYIQSAQQDYTTHAFFVPNDPGLSLQYGLKNNGQAILGQIGNPHADINAEPAWDVTQGIGVKVAILDTGINLNHPDLSGKVILQKSFVSNTVEDGNGHGTHVAGIIAADTNNGEGVAGTCPGCQLIIGKVLDDRGSGTSSNAVAGITWAADNGAKVINMSLGTTDPSTASLYSQAVTYALSKGSVVVAAAGNDNSSQLNWPAASQGVISVAATTNTDKRAGFSNFGSFVEIAAPGDNILSTAPTHSFQLEPSGYNPSTPYMYLSGTSMATPYVSGVAALIASTSFGATPQAITDRLYTTADKISGTGTYWIHGRVNAAAAVGPMPSPTGSPIPTDITPSVFCVGGNQQPPCASVPPSPTTGSGVTVSPAASANPSVHPSSDISTVPSTNPCASQSNETSIQAKKHKSGNFLQQFFQFLLQLIQLLLQFFEGQTPPTPTPTPAPSTSPSQMPSPSPASNPCPSITQSPAPSTSPSQMPSPSLSATITTNPSPSNAPTVSVSPTSANPSSQPSHSITSPSPSNNPCVSQTSISSTKIKKHMTHKRGALQNFFKFLFELFKLLLQLLGIHIPKPAPTPTPTPTPSTTPSQTPSSSPTPSANPCPSTTPSQAPSVTISPPSTNAPTVTNVPSSSPTSTAVEPVGVNGTWNVVFDDEFNRTSLDKTKWAPNWYGESGNMNNVTTHAVNVSVSGGNLILTLQNQNSGALVNTDPADAKPGFLFPVGDYAEARISFPGSGTTIDNWPAWWASTSLADGYPSAGENDIAEGLGTLTVNYHSKSGAHNMGTIPGTWSNAFHTYGIYRQAGKSDVYWDGRLVKSYSTDDNGQPQILIINVGAGEGPTVTGTAGQVKVDYVRVWKKG